MIKRTSLAALITFLALHADPVIHRFQIWSDAKDAKLTLYIGWTNGFLRSRGDTGADFEGCLSKMTYQQALAMIDKYFNDHPEKWSIPLTDGMLEALTVPGSPCEGKNPLATSGK